MYHSKDESNKTKEYMDIINLRCVFSLNTKINEIKTITNKTIQTIDHYNYSLLEYTNFSSVQLKQFSKQHKLKIVGTKIDLTNRLYCHLYLSSKIIIIQKYFRKYLVKTFLKSKGPALYKRSICVNDEDFLTMDKMADIPGCQFFSFKEKDGMVYGFDILSFHNLFVKTDNLTNKKGAKDTKTKQIENPYNRSIIHDSILNNYEKNLRIGKIIHAGINIQVDNIHETITKEKSEELRVLDLFQNINALGNYSDPNWFNHLHRSQLLRMVKELLEIWNFRSQITEETKRAICHPHGNPFALFNYPYVMSLTNIHEIREEVLSILENMCNKGIDHDSKALGAFYVLGALTLVSIPAANALPWLYQSVLY